MQIGFAMLEAGAVRSKNSQNIALKSILLGPGGAQDPLWDSFCAHFLLPWGHFPALGATRGSQIHFIAKSGRAAAQWVKCTKLNPEHHMLQECSPSQSPLGDHSK